jgi:hypothetical protein
MTTSGPPPGWTPAAGMVNVVVNVTVSRETTAVDRALDAMSIASGQWYRDAATTTQIPQFETVDSIPTPVEIYLGPRAATDMLADRMNGAYTWWTDNGHAAIAVADDQAPNWVQTIVMHELMLSRHIPEADDGGLLGHVILNTDTYTPTDLALIRGAP